MTCKYSYELPTATPLAGRSREEKRGRWQTGGGRAWALAKLSLPFPSPASRLRAPCASTSDGPYSRVVAQFQSGSLQYLPAQPLPRKVLCPAPPRHT